MGYFLYSATYMGGGRGGREGLGPSLDFESFRKNVACLGSSGKKQISPLLASPRKLLGISPSFFPWKKFLRRPWTRAERFHP